MKELKVSQTNDNTPHISRSFNDKLSLDIYTCK